MGFIIRLSFLVIMFLLYYIGDRITNASSTTIELKYILPIFSLVFFEYYLNLFTNLFFGIILLDKKIIQKDGKASKVRADLKLSFNGNKDICFKVKNIRIKKKSQTPKLIHKQNTYTVPEEFECNLCKANSSERITIECVFAQPLPPIISFLHYRLYYFEIEMHCTINHSTNRNKKIKLYHLEKRGA